MGGVESEGLEVQLQRLRRDPGQELTVVAWAVGAEVGQNGGERRGGEGQGEEVIQKRDHRVICSRFATEGKGFFGNALVDDAVGEHGLGCYAHDEGAEGGVFVGLGFCPHAWLMSASVSMRWEEGEVRSITPLTFFIAPTTCPMPSSKASRSLF